MDTDDDFLSDSPMSSPGYGGTLTDDVTKRTRSRAPATHTSIEEHEASEREKRKNKPKKKKSPPVSDLKGANGYSWEDQYQRSWDIVKDEDDTRSLETIVQKMIESRKKKIMKNPSTPFQRGIIRTLIVIIDGSLIMLEKDLRSSRFSKTLSLLQEFIVEFFDQNPISQLGILLMRNGVSQLISDVSGLPQYHLDKVRQVKARQHNRYEPKGDPSLQNSLEMARSLLRYNFGNTNNDSRNSKEILVIFGGLFTSDPGDIHQTIENLVEDEIKVRIIGLSAQVAICQEIVNRTHKTKMPSYGVIMNEHHFKELLMECVTPVPISEGLHETSKPTGIPLIKMGFPSKIQPQSTSSNGAGFSIEFPQLSASDPALGLDENKVVDVNDNDNDKIGTNVVGFQCPQCSCKVLSLPTVCPVCGLMLILSTHLARLYHHLVPLAPYKEVPVSSEYKSDFCFACLLLFPKGTDVSKEGLGLISLRYRCGSCNEDFCIDCDVFVHEVLHNCPGCDKLKKE